MRRSVLFVTTILAGSGLFHGGEASSQTFTVDSSNSTVNATPVGFASSTNGWQTAGTAGSHTYNFVAIDFSVDVTGSYTFGQYSAPVDTVMAVFLNGTFNPGALVNPNNYNDDSNNLSRVCGRINYCPEVTETITIGQSNTLVISTYRSGAVLGLPMQFFATGPGNFSFSVNSSSVSEFFEPVSQTNHTQEMAVVMDRLFGGVSGTASTDLQSAFTSLSSLGDTSRGEALGRVLPNTGAAFAQTTSRSLQRNSQRIGNRLIAVRSTAAAFAPLSAYADGESAVAQRVGQSFDALTSDGGEEYVAVATYGDASGHSVRPNSVWGQFYGFRTSQDEDQNFAGYNSFGHSYLAGFDIEPMDTAIAGIAAGYTKTYVDMADARDGDTSNVDSFQVSLYGTYEFAPDWVIDAIASYVRHQYESRRRTTLDTASAEFGGNQFGFAFDISKKFQTWNDVVIRPKAGLAWSGLYQEGYTETGSSLAQRIEANQTTTVASNVSLAVSKQFDVSERFSATPRIQAGWTHNFLTDGANVTARFVGGGDSFTSGGQALTADAFRVDAGVEVVRDSRLHVDLAANGEFADGFQEYGGQMRLSWKF